MIGVTMAIIDAGLTHRTAPPELLERLLVPPEEIPDLLHKLHAMPRVREVLVISTCNRIEAYLESDETPAAVRIGVAEALAPRAAVPADEIEPLLTTGGEAHAVEHLFSVLCGLDSMAVGEDQIVAQFRAAVRLATGARTIGPVLTRLADAGLTTSKRARTETGIGRRGISLAHAGVALGSDHLGGLAGRTAVLIGSGTVGSLAARLLREHEVARIVVVSRTEANAHRLAAAVGGEVAQLPALPEVLAGCDLVVTAIGATAPVLSPSQLAPARLSAGHRPLFVLDLGMPRDVDPDCRHIPGVTVVDIETLGRHLAERELPDDVGHVRAVVAQEAAAFLARRRESAAVPLIGALRSRAQEAVDTELLRLHDRLSGLDDRQRAETAAAVQRVVSKLLHGPTVRAKELSAAPDGTVYIEALSRLFDLNGKEAKA
jgi:glutamyl-tRNA reductase